jgi:dynein heavy chain
VGVGGSGKQSLAKFAAFVANCDLCTVSMSVGYNLARFRDEVKHVLKVRS